MSFIISPELKKRMDMIAKKSDIRLKRAIKSRKIKKYELVGMSWEYSYKPFSKQMEKHLTNVNGEWPNCRGSGGVLLVVFTEKGKWHAWHPGNKSEKEIDCSAEMKEEAIAEATRKSLINFISMKF